MSTRAGTRDKESEQDDNRRGVERDSVLRCEFRPVGRRALPDNSF